MHHLRFNLFGHHQKKGTSIVPKESPAASPVGVPRPPETQAAPAPSPQTIAAIFRSKESDVSAAVAADAVAQWPRLEDVAVKLSPGMIPPQSECETSEIRPPLPPKPHAILNAGLRNSAKRGADESSRYEYIPQTPPSHLLGELVDYACAMLPRLFESESVPPHEHLATHPSDSFNPILYFMDPSYRYFADTSESVKVKEPPTINPPSIDSYQPLPLPAITISSPPCSLPTLNQHQIPPQPPPPLKQFIAKLMKRTQLSHSSFVHALHLLHNIHHLHPTLRTLKNPECSRNYTFLMHRLLLGSLIISAKVLYDDTYDNQAWKAVAQGICTTVEDVNLLERAMLAILDFNVGASMSRLEWRRFCDNVANGLAELCCSDDGTGLAGAVTSIGREQEVSGSGCWVCWGDSNNPVQEEEEKLTPLPTNPPLIDESENNYQQLQNHQSAQLYGIRLKRNLVREIIYADTDSLVNSVDYSTVITRNRLVAMSESKKAEIIAVAEAAVAAENVTVPELEEQVRMRVFRSHLDIERGQDSAVELIGLSHLFLDDIPGTKDEEDDDFQILDCDGDLLQ